jgi:hypothetical protein
LATKTKNTPVRSATRTASCATGMYMDSSIDSPV